MAVNWYYDLDSEKYFQADDADAAGMDLVVRRNPPGTTATKGRRPSPYAASAAPSTATAGPLSTAMQMVQTLQASGIDASVATKAQLEAARQAVGARSVSATSGAAPQDTWTQSNDGIMGQTVWTNSRTGEQT